MTKMTGKPHLNADKLEYLKSFFYVKISDGSLDILYTLNLHWVWVHACEDAALEIGDRMIRNHDGMKQFIIRRYEIFRDRLEEYGFIPEDEFLGPSITAGMALSTIPEGLPIY